MSSVYPIVDFHCDLLMYLRNHKDRTPSDPISRCSYPQMQQGGVKVQILPISETLPPTSKIGEEQLAVFYDLPKRYPEHYQIPRTYAELALLDGPIKILPAVENASVICADEDPLEERLKRIVEVKPVYISLTWNFENRFGGGALTNVGLKDDGKALLDAIHDQHIAIDFSHASDPLAKDILDYIDQHKLNIPVIASHSNCRTIQNVERNLPDELIQEIVQREGIIGLNTIRYFVSSSDETSEKFAKHLKHLIDLGGRNHACFGLDFFYEEDVGPFLRKKAEELFFPEYANASCYPSLVNFCSNSSPDVLEHLTHQNALRFLKKFMFS